MNTALTVSDLHWERLHIGGGNIILPFADARPRHIAVIPEEVLEDGLSTFNEQPQVSVIGHRPEIEAAITVALNRRGWRELVQIDTGEQLNQLWITRDDFGR